MKASPFIDPGKEEGRPYETIKGYSGIPTTGPKLKKAYHGS
jgi:hypothetical protein